MGSTSIHTVQTQIARAQRLPPPRTHHGQLLADMGAFCKGCGADYTFDPRVPEVDHINPRSQGGIDAYENLTLLCPPCNNRRNGYMRNENNLRLGRSRGRTSRRKRRQGA